MSTPAKPSYEFAPFRLDTAEQVLWRDGQAITLTPKVFGLLLALVENGGRVVEKDELMQRVWPDAIVEENNLTVTMSALRKILGESENFIETVPRRGYRFTAPVKIVWEQREETTRDEEPTATQPPDAPQSASPPPSLRRWFWIAGGFVLLGAIACLDYLLFAPRQLPLARRVVPLTSFPGLKQQPAFSPDGKQIAFVWNGEQGDNPDIYIRQTNAEGLLRLTNDPAADANPVWSPDGRYVAFLRAHAGGSGIYLAPALGGAERKLTDARTSWYWQNLDWSPDGDYLIVADRSEDRHGLLLITVASGERKQLTLPPTTNLADGYPKFSPDGKRVAFVRGTSFFVGDVYVTDMAGGTAQRLTHDDRWLTGLAWADDSREIVFSSNRGGLLSLWRVAAAGGAPQALPVAGEDAMFPAIAKNQLAYTRWKTDSNLWRIAGPNATEQERAKLPEKLIASTRDDALPQYSPDGQRIAFLSARSGYEEVWLAHSDGRNPIQLTALQGAPGGSPRWSPDGKRIVFDCRLEGHGDIFVINVEGGVEGGAAKRLTTEPSEDIVPSWSRDGRWIYFTSNRSSSQQIWKLPADGGTAMQVTQQGGFEAFESADGKTLYYQKDNAIWQFVDGAETRVIDGVEWGYWAVTAQGLCFLNRKTTPQFTIELFDFATQQVRRLANVEKDPNIISPPGFAVSPDGRWILYKRIDQHDNEIMLVENYR
ncbi:MAG: PD40 domain-containing protein [Blastocatellia bacterium]|nr:PD40 domain-containing protein [Blastocatellia bacterium]